MTKLDQKIGDTWVQKYHARNNINSMMNYSKMIYLLWKSEETNFLVRKMDVRIVLIIIWICKHVISILPQKKYNWVGKRKFDFVFGKSIWGPQKDQRPTKIGGVKHLSIYYVAWVLLPWYRTSVKHTDTNLHSFSTLTLLWIKHFRYMLNYMHNIFSFGFDYKKKLFRLRSYIPRTLFCSHLYKCTYLLFLLFSYFF